MNLVSVRIITANIENLISFYENVTGIEAVRYTPDFAEIRTATATLAIGSTKTLLFWRRYHCSTSKESNSNHRILHGGC